MLWHISIKKCTCIHTGKNGDFTLIGLSSVDLSAFAFVRTANLFHIVSHHSLNFAFAFGSHMIFRQKQCQRCHHVKLIEWMPKLFSRLSVHILSFMCVWKQVFRFRFFFFSRLNVEKSIIVTFSSKQNLNFRLNFLNYSLKYAVLFYCFFIVRDSEWADIMSCPSQSNEWEWIIEKKRKRNRTAADYYVAIF